MCNCINTVPKQYADYLGHEHKGKKIKRVSIGHTVIPMTDDMALCASRIAIPLKIDRENTQRPAQDMLIATYCPFCGQAYDSEEAQ